jgi:glycogen debranching enzyme
MHQFLFFLLFLFPAQVFAADSFESLLKPKVTGVHRSVVCLTKKDCRALFFMEGKNFSNSNCRGGVKIGKEWGTILRWTDTHITAVTSVGNKSRTPIVSVKTTLRKPVLISKDVTFVNMFDESIEVALQSIRQRSDGSRYIVAGPKYTDPERVYYRDSYWASGLLLFIEPAFVRDQILLLARGVEKDGSVPSAIPVDPKDIKMPLWANHYDAGSYFIMTVYDYVRFTGDQSILREIIQGRTIFESAKQILAYLETQDHDGNALPEKPKDSLQDWLDQIPRSGEVLSNEVLYFRALRNMSELGSLMRDGDAEAYDLLSTRVKEQINKQFWNPVIGTYRESCFEGVCIDRLTNESSLAILFDVIAPQNRDRFFQNLLNLETRKNPNVLYGDWGVLNAYPFYENDGRPYVYQNGTDWPFLDAMNAGARLKYHNPDWYYPLTRWWTYFDSTRARGERLPEYVSPIDHETGLDQAWSTSPITSLLRYGFGIDPDLEGNYVVQPSPLGNMRVSDVMIRGKRISVEVKEK